MPHEYFYSITYRPQSRPAAVARINELVRQHGLLIKLLEAHEDTLFVVFVAREPVADMPSDERM